MDDLVCLLSARLQQMSVQKGTCQHARTHTETPQGNAVNTMKAELQDTISIPIWRKDSKDS